MAKASRLACTGSVAQPAGLREGRRPSRPLEVGRHHERLEMERAVEYSQGYSSESRGVLIKRAVEYSSESRGVRAQVHATAAALAGVQV